MKSLVLRVALFLPGGFVDRYGKIGVAICGTLIAAAYCLYLYREDHREQEIHNIRMKDHQIFMDMVITSNMERGFNE
jgi:hypothetical protein